MKTMFIIADYAANYPGNFIASLLALEAKMKENTRFIYFFADGATNDFLNWTSDFSNDHECHTIPFNKSGRKVVIKMINEINPSYLYFHFTGLHFSYSIYHALNKSQRKSIKFIQHIHSNPKAKGGIKGRLKHLASRYLCPKSLYLIACSKDAYEILKTDYRRQKIFLSPNKIDFSRLTFSPGKQPDQKQNMTALTFCYDYHVKGGDIAAAAAKALHAKYPSFRLLMVIASHEVEVRDNLKKDFPNYQEFIDILPPSNDVGKLYALSSIYFLPSRTEGLPYATIEASYSGLTVICSDLPTLRDANIPRAKFFPVGSFKEAMRLIEEAFQSNVEKVDESVFKKYSMDVWANREIEIIQEIDNG